MIKLSKLELSRLYLDEKKTDLEIAKLFECNKATIYEMRKKHGIKALAKWERHDANLTDRQLEIIYGSLLGDSSVSKPKKKNHNSVIEFKHCAKQKKYLWWKYKELSNICQKIPSKLKNKQWRFRTFHHPVFTNLRKSFYPKGTKIVSLEQLSKIGPLGLAVWYMDDGTISNNHCVKLCTCSFTKKEHKILSSWMMSKFGIVTEIKTFNGYRFLIISKGYKRKFFDIIKNYILPSMSYKIALGENYV